MYSRKPDLSQSPHALWHKNLKDIAGHLKLAPGERQLVSALREASSLPEALFPHGKEEALLPEEEPPRRKESSKRSVYGKRRQNLAQKMAEARLARERGEQEMGIALRPLVMCGLPLRRVEGSLWSRRCGEYRVDIIAHPDFGVPYGQDRLIPIFIATLFVYQGCPASNEVHFSSMRDMLRLFGLPVDGKTYRRFQEGFARVSKSFFSLERTFLNNRGRKVRQTENIPLLSKVRLWRDEDLSKPPDAGADNVIMLNDALAREIREHPIPVDLQVVKALATFPGALDLYQWQSWRSFFVQEETHIPLEGEAGLFAQLGFQPGQPEKEMRRKVRAWQEQIRFLWKDCPNRLSEDGQAFLLYPARALGHLEANRFLLQGIRGARR